MNKEIAMKAENAIKRLVNKVVVGFSFDVFAEEDPSTGTPPAPVVTPPTPPTPATIPTLDVAALINQVRQEEKNKLYPDIEKWKTKFEKYKALYDEMAAEKVEQGKNIKELENKLKGVEDPDLIKTLNTKIAELEAKLKEKPDEEAIRKEIRATLEKEQEVKDYVAKVIDENSNVLLTVFSEAIKGATNEEVDKALADAIEKSKKTRKDLGLPEVDTKTTKAGTKKPKAPVANPQVTNTSPNIEVSELQSMDVRSPEYKEFRKQLGLK